MDKNKTTIILVVLSILIIIITSIVLKQRLKQLERKNEVKSELSRGSKLMIEKGLQIQCWVPTDKIAEQKSWMKYPTASEINDLGLTAVQYNDSPNYNSVIHKQYKELKKSNSKLPDLKWGIAFGPFGKHLSSTNLEGDANSTGRPTEFQKEKGFLSNEQLDDLKNLNNICFGDEENYSDTLIQILKEWFDASKKLYPDVMVHHNEIGGRGGGGAFDEIKLRKYVQVAKPDFITYDLYNFREQKEKNEVGGTTLEFYEDLSRYRTVAQEGLDGTGKSPIPFGRYMQAWRTGPGAGSKERRGDGWYEITESQVYLNAFATWTFGGKWLSLFRWVKDSPQYLFYDYRPDEDGNIQKYHLYDKYKEMIRQSKNLGNHLVRINNKEILMLPGQHMERGEVIKNPQTSLIKAWTKQLDEAYVDSIKVKNLGPTNDKLPGDVFIGYFEPLDGLNKKEFFTSTEPKYFMILNGLTHGNGKPVEEQMGSSYETRQQITVTFDLNSKGKKLTQNKLKKVSRLDGEITNVPLKDLGNGKFEMTLEIGGGMADLFFWELGNINKGNLKGKVSQEQVGDYRLIGNPKEAKNREIKNLNGRTLNIGWIKDTYNPMPSSYINITVPKNNPNKVYERDFEVNLWNRRLERIQKESNVKIKFIPNINWNKDQLIDKINSVKNGQKNEDIPDILIVPDEWTWSGLIANKSILPASSLKSFNFSDRKWNKAYKEMTTYNNEVYGMYSNASPAGCGLFVNKSLLSTLDVKEDLYELQDKGLWNISKLKEITNKIINNKELQGVYAFGNTADFFRQLVYSNGGQLIKNGEKEQLEVNLNSESFKESAKLYSDFYSSGLILDKPKDMEDKWYLEQFKNGKILFLVLPFNVGYNYLKEAEVVDNKPIPQGDYAVPAENWQFVMFPKGDKMKSYASIIDKPSYPVMLSTTVNTEEAGYVWNQLTEEFVGVQFNRFLLSYPNQRSKDRETTIKRIGLKEGVGDISKSLGVWDEVIEPNIIPALKEGYISEDNITKVNLLIEKYLTQKGYKPIIKR